MSQNTTSDMTTDNATVAEPEHTKNNPSQAAVEKSTRTYTQEDVDNIMAKVVARTEGKVLKKFDGVDVELYKNLLAKEEQSKIEEQKKRGEFEKILKETVEKKDSRINTLTEKLHAIQVDQALLNAAAAKKAISPEQVVKLVRDSVKMRETGEVEIVDHKTGQTRYNERGEPLDVDGFVTQFLRENPHFTMAGPAGGGSKSNASTDGVQDVDINKLDLMDPKQRALYKELRNKKYGRPAIV